VISRIALFSVWLALIPVAAAAHAGHEHHVLGTIKTIDATHIVVQTTDEKTHEVKAVAIALNGTTKIRRGDEAAKRSDLRVGERVVVSVGTGKEPLKATEVRVAAQP
jgi:hypothetical protein